MYRYKVKLSESCSLEWRFIVTTLETMYSSDVDYCVLCMKTELYMTYMHAIWTWIISYWNIMTLITVTNGFLSELYSTSMYTLVLKYHIRETWGTCIFRYASKFSLLYKGNGDLSLSPGHPVLFCSWLLQQRIEHLKIHV